jgi:hypothetical protein
VNDLKIAADITMAIAYPTALPAAKKCPVQPELAFGPTIFPSLRDAGLFFLAPIDPDILPTITKMWREFKAGQ